MKCAEYLDNLRLKKFGGCEEIDVSLVANLRKKSVRILIYEEKKINTKIY